MTEKKMPERSRLTAAENDTLKRLMVAAQILSEEKDLEKRLKTIPRGSLLWGQARAACIKLLELVCDTMPTEQLANTRKNLDLVTYQIGIRRPGKPHMDDYGKPEDSFGRIAALWTAYTGHEYTAHDVAMMMALLKAARIRTGHGGVDSYVDMAGYAACAGELVGKRDD